MHANGGFNCSPRADFPPTLRLRYNKVMDLRYGENPHQKAAMYSDGSDVGVANGKQLQGKELSYNNIVDLQASWDLAAEFDEPSVAIIKHTNPWGSAAGKDLIEAYRALECDPVSAFGSVIASTARLTARPLRQSRALHRCHRRLLRSAARARFSEEGPAPSGGHPGAMKYVVKAVSGGVLVQDDLHKLITATSKWSPTSAHRAGDERPAVRLESVQARKVERDLVRPGRPQRGRRRRPDEPRGLRQDRRHEVGARPQGSVAASDAFFPFPDGVEEIAKAGATAIIQPGGSVRDQEVIDAANRLGLAMVTTGIRHFRH